MYTQKIKIEGVVQGVGFRPFVAITASQFGVHGYIKNTLSGVEIVAQAEKSVLSNFVEKIEKQTPSMAYIHRLSVEELRFHESTYSSFSIAPSNQSTSSLFLPMDSAPCARCLDDMMDPKNRRYRYPFTTCCECGPRFSILSTLPFDRCNTSMKSFPLCDDCLQEYGDIDDRRYHGQTISCPKCGPKLTFIDSLGVESREEPICKAVNVLKNQGVLLVKGVGGYQLMANLGSEKAIEKLKVLKNRTRKSFALMMPSIDDCFMYLELSDSAKVRLRSANSPIVLGKKRYLASLDKSHIGNSMPFGREIEQIESISMDSPDIGVMLPSSPLHFLLLNAVGSPLVCTSANKPSEPMFIDDAAIHYYQSIVDGVLTHDRVIHHRLDDAIFRDMGDHTLCIRLGRGSTPLVLDSPLRTENLIALGGQQKNTFCVGAAQQDHQSLLVSQHQGDVHSIKALDAMDDEIVSWQSLMKLENCKSIFDKHPNFLNKDLSKRFESSINIQHHRAHIYSCALEHQVKPGDFVLGLALDGYGFGDDGQAWGGECFAGPLHAITHQGGLSSVAFNSTSFVKEPWRMLLSYLDKSGLDSNQLSSLSAINSKKVETLHSVIRKLPDTCSSLGRLLDAVSFSLGCISSEVEYEGQGPLVLEKWAERNVHDECFPYEILAADDGKHYIDTRKAWQTYSTKQEELRDSRESRYWLARSWLNTCIHAFAELVHVVKEKFGQEGPVILTGGCLQNRIISSGLKNALEEKGCQVLLHSTVPCNDAGLSVGQIYAFACMQWAKAKDTASCA